MRTAALLLWAAVATIFAVLGHLREEPPARGDAPRAPYEERERGRRLERRVQELEAALAEVMPPAAPPKEGEATLATLMDAHRILWEDESEASPAALNALSRQIFGRIAVDATAHLELMDLLPAARNDDDVHRILSYLLENPFVRLVTSTEVTAKIREAARALLVSPEPHLRAAAARVLLGYRAPGREDVVLAIERLSGEPEAEVFDALLAEIADKGRGVPLTVRDAEPLLQKLREGVREGRDWNASMLADWSADAEDFERIKAAFRADPSQGNLNAFRRETRMVEPRVDECRAFLVQVIEDPHMDRGVRLTAAYMLHAYAPWDAATAEAVARAER